VFDEAFLLDSHNCKDGIFKTDRALHAIRPHR
jgi:hypothetical protein